MAHLVLFVMIVFAGFSVMVSEGLTSKKGTQYEPAIHDYCPGGWCSSNKTPLRKDHQEQSSKPCGPIAIWHVVKAQCGLRAAVPYREVVRLLESDWGIPNQGMAKRLNRNFRHPGNQCPAGEWYSYNATEENFIEMLRRATTGGRVALVTTQTGGPSTLHWYVIEQVKAGASCTVYVKDSEGRDTFTCETFRWLADDLFNLAGTPDHTIVWFKPATAANTNRG